MEQYKVDFASLPWEQCATGVRHKAREHDASRLRLAEFTKDFVEPDWCTKGHIGYVLKGRMELDFHGKVVVFGPGDGLLIPPGTEHGHKARVLTDSVRVVLVEGM
jgi:hypothetical protein